MAFSRTWDTSYEAVPADTDQASQGAQRIRNTRIDVRERLAVDHSWAGDANDGKHKWTTLIEQASDPTSAANTGFVYAKDVGGVTELFYEDSSGNVIQLTVGGKIEGGSLDGVATTQLTGILQASTFDDTSHGSRSGGTLHSNATTSVAGFLSATDKTALDDLNANAQRQLTTVDLNGNALTIDADGDTTLQANTNDQIDWKIGGTVRHVFAGQNVGFGVSTLESWGSTLSVAQIGGTGSLMAETSAGAGKALYLLQNAYNDGTNWKYQVTDEASSYSHLNGKHFFSVAPAGTAGTNITWTLALQIYNSGIAQFYQPIGVGSSGAGQAILVKPSSFSATDALIVQDSAGTIRTRIDQDGITGLRSGTTPAGVLEIGDNGTTKSTLCKITADDGVVWGLIIGNDTFSTTDTDGLTFNTGDDGTCAIRSRGTGSNVRLGTPGDIDALQILNDGAVKLSGATGTVSGSGKLNAQFLYENGVRAKVGSVPNTYHDYGTGSGGLAADFSTYGFIKFIHSSSNNSFTITPTWPNFPGEEDRLFLNVKATTTGTGTLANTGLSTDTTATSVNIPTGGTTQVYTFMPAPSGWPAAVSWIVVSIDT